MLVLTPSELVLMPVLAEVEIVWMPAELTVTPDLFVLMLTMLMLIDDVFSDMFVEI